jgi:RNA polymerase sigma factor (sigma-70 family)
VIYVAVQRVFLTCPSRTDAADAQSLSSGTDRLASTERCGWRQGLALPCVGAADESRYSTAAVSFQPRPDHELHELPDEDLIAHIRDARDAGELPQARRGLMFLVYGYERDVKRRLSIKVPSHVVEDLAHDALVRAIAAAFDGSSVGEFRNWLHTIVDRAAVDFYRRAERRPKETTLPSEHAGKDDVWGAEPSLESEAGAVELRIIVEEVFNTFNEKHRLVIELHIFQGLPAAEVCDRIEGMSEDNVAQIASRFRAKLRARLEPADQS